MPFSVQSSTRSPTVPTTPPWLHLMLQAFPSLPGPKHPKGHQKAPHAGISIDHSKLAVCVTQIDNRISSQCDNPPSAAVPCSSLEAVGFATSKFEYTCTAGAAFHPTVFETSRETVAAQRNHRRQETSSYTSTQTHP